MITTTISETRFSFISVSFDVFPNEAWFRSKLEFPFRNVTTPDSGFVSSVRFCDREVDGGTEGSFRGRLTLASSVLTFLSLPSEDDRSEILCAELLS